MESGPPAAARSYLDVETIVRAARETGAEAVLRQYGVILDWGTGELRERTTEQFRAMLERRAARHWD